MLAGRIVRDRRLTQITDPLIKPGRLETMGEQDDVRAVPSPGFSFHSLQEGATQTYATPRFVNRKVRDLTGTAPRMPGDRGNDVAHVVLDPTNHRSSIEYPGGSRIELIDPFSQECVQLAS